MMDAKALYGGVSVGALLALGLGNAAVAQTAAPANSAEPPAALEELVVTGSRIARAGFVAPTPVTVVSAEQAKLSAPNDIADSLATLPAFRGMSVRSQDTGTSSNGNAGASLLSLRGLGPNRTLVLLNGRRVVSSNVNGSTDVNLIPQDLVSRVDVVTGGASAAWGSDAMAGVVNFALDTNFQGLKGEVQGGISKYNDAGSYKANLTFGKHFLDGRARLIGSAEYYHKDDISTYSTERAWRNSVTGWITNATGKTPTRVLAEDIRYTARSEGGMIPTGPLAGIQFLPGGVPAPFNYGPLVGSVLGIGGDGPTPVSPFGAKVDRWTAFAHGEYDFSDKLTGFIELMAASSDTPYQQYYSYTAGAGVETIFSGNPFIPASIQQRMTAQNIASFPLARINADMASNVADNHSSTQRLAAGFDGKIAGDWTYNLYYTHGESHQKVYDRHIVINRPFYAATDAVVNPQTGVIVCRSQFYNGNTFVPGGTGLDKGCVPINPFGEGSISAAGQAYVTGDSWKDLNLTQDVLSGSFQGSLPFLKLWDEPASLAFGGEYRKEKAAQTSDLISQQIVDYTGIRGGPPSQIGQQGGFYASNPQPISGQISIKEAFAELGLPIVRDHPFFEELSLNGAARIADYSTSGAIKTWKIGGVWKPYADLKLRITRSRDIRSPNITELFSGGAQGTNFVFDSKTNTTVPYTSQTKGNPQLQPETADTLTFGGVYEPSFLPGFGMSVDYYDIDISGAIASLGAQGTLDECNRGSAVACAQIQFIGGAYRMALSPLNLASLQNRGIDIEASYSFPLYDGRMNLRALANRTLKNKSLTPGSVAFDRATEAGQDNATFTGTYERGPWTLFLQERYIGAGLYNVQYVTGVDIDYNHVPEKWYTDMTVKYKFQAFGSKSEAFLTINNLFNRKPAVLNSLSTFVGESDYSRYDPIGRYFTTGVRFRY
jgi:iron complex outermembrane receptor protein